jgi:ABC-type long-subunit fatty acid transport system fused permease/ATPase subunit
MGRASRCIDSDAATGCSSAVSLFITLEDLSMDLVSLVVVLVVVGVLLWLVNNYIPMDSKIKQILNIVVVVAVVVWLLNVLGLMGSIRGVRVGR